MITVATADRSLWGLALGGQPINAQDWARALEEQAGPGARHLDFRTRLLIRDGLDALESHWGRTRFDAWLATVAVGNTLREIRSEDLGPTGFPSLKDRLMQPIRAEVVHQFLRELGLQLDTPAKLEIGGAIALILAGELERATEDIDVVDEIPAIIRAKPQLLDRLAQRFGLHLADFQSHYLPTGWEQRVHSLGRFGSLDVFVIDTIDVLLGKLFSSREKDRDDLRALLPRIEREPFLRRLRETCQPMLTQPQLAKAATDNWYVTFGEPLPTEN